MNNKKLMIFIYSMDITKLTSVKILEELSIVPTSMIDISDGLSSEALHIGIPQYCLIDGEM